MTDFDTEQRAMDAAIRRENTGMVMQVLGWTLLLFCAIPAALLFTGWRAGSLFWFWVVAGLGTVGVVLLASGMMVRSSANRAFELASEAIRHRAQTVSEAERTGSEDIQDKAA